MASKSYKAQAIAAQLLSDLNQRGPLTYTLSADSNGSPVLSTGSGSAGAQNVVILVQNWLVGQNASATTASAPLPYLDELGNPALALTPTQILISLETSSVANIPLVTAANLMPALYECSIRGCEVKVLLTANGTAPTSGAGTQKADMSTLQYAGIGQV